MNRTRCWGRAALVVLAIPWLVSAGPPLRRVEFSEPHMGTLFRIVLYGRSSQPAPAEEAEEQRAAAAAFRRVAQLDSIMSDYRPTSELMELCRQAGAAPVRVSPELFTVLAEAQALARRSGGAFDVTVGPVVRLWRRARRQHEMPDPGRLARALELVGFEKIQLDERARTAQLLKPGMLLDLGGIAKGYAADEALGVLKRRGFPRALVAAAGDIAVGDPPPDRAGWTIDIAPLEDGGPPPRRSIVLSNAAVSTSGDAEQFVELGGKRYSHILNPKTGLPLSERMSVTVVARRGITSDSLTKVVCVLGPSRGIGFIEATEGAAALFVRSTKQGFQEFESKRWKEQFPFHP